MWLVDYRRSGTGPASPTNSQCQHSADVRQIRSAVALRVAVEKPVDHLRPRKFAGEVTSGLCGAHLIQGDDDAVSERYWFGHGLICRR